MLQQRIPATSIFRPGLLDRGADARGGEKMFLSIMSNIKVRGPGGTGERGGMQGLQHAGGGAQA